MIKYVSMIWVLFVIACTLSLVVEIAIEAGNVNYVEAVNHLINLR